VIETSVLNADTETWPKLRKAFTLLKNPLPVFQLLLFHLNDISSSKQFMADLFVVFVPLVSAEADLSQIFPTCIKLIFLRDPTILVSVCDVARSLLENNLYQLDSDTDLLPRLLDLAFHSTFPTGQKKLYDLCEIMASKLPDGLSQVQRYLEPIVAQHFDQWSYDLSKSARGSLPYRGLTNQGATCYMNSVLQQFFHIRKFRSIVFESTFDDDDKREFQMVFFRLELSFRPWVDTRCFCSLCKGWGNKLINIREQQDANEFLNLFLDQIPSACQKLFSGELIHTISGINHDYCVSRPEKFFSLSLDIRNLGNVQQSFASFLQSEHFMGNDQISTETYGKIDGTKSTRIGQLPTVLILHLKRFEYSLRPRSRSRVNSEFDFPIDLDASSLLATPQPAQDRLHGVVLHSGTARAGHYQSLIKIDTKWYRFNDMNVSEFNESGFKREAFGGNETGPCAFLLFYSRVEPESPAPLEIPESVRAVIDAEKKEYSTVQALFSSETLYFISQCKSTEIILTYLLNVYCHSLLDSDSHVITLRLHQLLEERQEVPLLFEFLHKNVAKLIDVYANCSHVGIIATIHDIVDPLLAYPIPVIVDLTDVIVGAFPLFGDKWRQIEFLAHIPAMALSSGLSLSDDVKAKWRKLSIDFVTSLFSRKDRRIVSDCNLWSVFMILSFVEIQSEPSPLLLLFDEIVSNKVNIIPWFTYLVCSRQPIPLSDLFVFFRVQDSLEFNPSEFMQFVIVVLTKTDDDISDTIFHGMPHLRPEQIIQSFLESMRNKNENLRSVLISRFSSYICPLCGFLTFQVSQSMLNLIQELFSRVVPIASHPGKTPIAPPPLPDASVVLSEFADLFADAIVRFVYFQGESDSMWPTRAVVLVLQWLMKSSNHYSERCLDALVELFQRYSPLVKLPDAGISTIQDTIFLFPPALIGRRAPSFLETLMPHLKRTEFLKLAELILDHAAPSDHAVLRSDSVFAAAVQILKQPYLCDSSLSTVEGVFALSPERAPDFDSFFDGIPDIISIAPVVSVYASAFDAQRLADLIDFALGAIVTTRSYSGIPEIMLCNALTHELRTRPELREIMAQKSFPKGI
jgi:ubiquitin C-terminal hydrolase